MSKDINPNLRRLARLTQNPNQEVPSLEEIKEEVAKASNNHRNQRRRLDLDPFGRPKVELKDLENVIINAPAIRQYNTLMQVCECAGKEWGLGGFPTHGNYWNTFGKSICIEFKEEKLSAKGLGYHQKMNRKVITPDEFYESQGITDSIISQINSYFDSK